MVRAVFVKSFGASHHYLVGIARHCQSGTSARCIANDTETLPTRFCTLRYGQCEPKLSSRLRDCLDKDNECQENFESARIISRPWAADIDVKECVDQMACSRGSLARMVQPSPDLKRMLADIATSQIAPRQASI